MRPDIITRNGSRSTPDSTAAHGDERWHDVWIPENQTRVLIDGTGARTTFIFDNQSQTVLESPSSVRVTLTSCPSQMTIGPAGLSHFAAHAEFRAEATSTSVGPAAGVFLGHHESQRHITIAATAALRTPSQRARWLDDVIQQANIQLLEDLRQRRAIFRGDDPLRFARWFHGTTRHVAIDAIKHCVPASAVSRPTAMQGNVADPNAVEPVAAAILREVTCLICDEIEQIREPQLREVLRDLLDGTATQDSARSLGITESKARRMRKRGRRLIARRLGR